MSKVSRDKYESLKEKASQWRDKTLDYKRRYEDILEENEKLISEIDELQDRLFLFQENDNSREAELKKENEELCEKLNRITIKYKEIRKQIRQWEKEKEEERLLEKLSKRVSTQQ